MELSELNERYCKQRADYPEPFRLRVHRALSWLQRADVLLADSALELNTVSNRNAMKDKKRLPQNARQALEKESTDWDFGFVSLWIAFNAIYARDLSVQVIQDSTGFRQFLNIICQLDKDKQIYNLVWRVFSSDIRALVNNRYVFQPFWNFHNGLISEHEFNQSFQSARERTNRALMDQDTDKLLEIVFSCLYTLRNQIVHGGATWNSSANRQQVQAACTFLGKILPVFLEIMMANPHRSDWGKPFYPFVKEE
jgi:hypothetical protein